MSQENLPTKLNSQNEINPVETNLAVVEKGQEIIEKVGASENLPEEEMAQLRERIEQDTNKLNALRAGLGLQPNNEPVPSLQNSIVKLKSFEDSRSQNENSEFSEEKRKELSSFFVESLRNEKKFVEENIEHIRGIVRDSSIEAFKGLMIFNRAVQRLSRDSRVPEKDRMILKVHESNLSPIGAMEILPETSSYAFAIKSVLSTLDKLLTKEVSIAIHAYTEKIFVPPAQDYAKHGPEPFDGVLFKKGE